MKAFGERLLLLRKSKKISQAKLGRLIGASGDVIGRYERGDITPSVQVVAKMADVLEVFIDYLIGKSGFLYDKALIQRIEAIAQLSDVKQAFIFKLVDMVLRDISAQKVYGQ